MEETRLLAVLGEAAAAVAFTLEGFADWEMMGEREDQYALDLKADAAALAVLHGAGLAVLSEESGLTGGDRALLAVLDPVDGSTNASRRIPWYATSICVLDAAGPLAALVVNQANGWSYEAVRGQGATRDGSIIRARGDCPLDQAVVCVSGVPPRPVPWWQSRALGAAALELCAVADGSVDGFCEYGRDQLGPWDYLGGTLVCQEAGAAVTDAAGRDLVERTHAGRRSPVAAGNPSVLADLVAFRKTG